MNLTDLVPKTEKPVTAKNILKDKASITLIRLNKEGVLNKHQSNSNALLILLEGKVVYEEDNRSILLSNVNDFVNIPEKVTHLLRGDEDSLLILIQ